VAASTALAVKPTGLLWGIVAMLAMCKHRPLGSLMSMSLMFGEVDAQTMTCSNVKSLYQSNACCDATADKVVDKGVSGLTDPPVPGVMAKNIVLGMAPDYPPYTTFTATTPKELGGFSKEFADLMLPTCGMRVSMILDSWDQCWTSKPSNIYFAGVTEYVGKSIMEGKVHGCTAYTHTKGERELSLEFSQSYLSEKKTAGILTRLVSGAPVVSPALTDYTGVKLGDVTGWAPTADTFLYTKNHCATGSPLFTKTDAIIASTTDPNANAVAIQQLIDGTFDALFIYSDQLDNFARTGTAAEKALAAKLGTSLAYIHQGLSGWSRNGTTLAISKKGSGLASVLNPCIEKVVKTQAYNTLCAKYPTLTCIRNSFSTGADVSMHYDDPMNARTTPLKACSDGYCKCAETR
jgi:hypothetical protein